MGKTPNEFQIMERDTVQKLVDALQKLPELHTDAPVWHPSYGGRELDAEVDFTAGNQRHALLIEVKKEVYPRDVRQILWQIRRSMEAAQRSDPTKSIVPLLAAQSISDGAKDVLKAEKVGYFDAGGSLFIPANGAYFYIEKPPPKTLTKSIRALFKGKSSQVLHALLHRRDSWTSVKELADLAHVSSATASETLTELERLEWAASKGLGPSKERRLSDPTALLNEWTKQVLATAQPVRRYYVPATPVNELPARLDAACEPAGVDYVITQEAAAQVYAPFLSTISRVACWMPPGQAAKAALSKLEARVVTEGANLLVIETKSQGEFLFKERHASVWLANPVQVYLDLLRSSGRAQEAAEHLRREKIGV